MPLEPGSKLGEYEIVAALETTDGSERYRASDPNAKRDVAIRVFATAVSERGQQEAMAVAALHHPNICAVHDIGQDGDVGFVVQECLEGPTLAGKLAGGKAMPLDEAVAAAIEIADALGQAHLAGVAHRSLQPSKIVLTGNGTKLLDFGLAEQTGDAGLAYTAPEVLNGKEGDARSDIFSFGAILYQMVTGRQAFDGRSRAVMIAAIATTDPEPITKYQPAAPALLQHIVDRCLAKDPEERWQTAHDLLLQLRWMTEGAKLEGEIAGLSKLTKILLAGAAAATLALAAPAWLYFRGAPDPPPFQFRVPIRGLSPADIALSPDGEAIAMVARPSTAQPAAIHVRQIGSLAFRRLGGTEDAAQPFWSADSRFIGFVAGGRLKQVAAGGGAPKDIADAQGFSGGTWSREGTILFGSAKGIYRVSAEGGTPVAITTPDGQESGHYWPDFLPDGRSFLYLAWSEQAGGRAIFAGKLDSKEKTRLMATASNVVYAAPGYILFHREASVFAQPFDARKLALTGEPVHVADEVATSSGNGRGNFAASQTGTLLYFQGAGAPTGRGRIMNNNVQWAWVSRNGTPIEPAGDVGPYGDFDLSPDGKLLAVTKQEGGPGADIWVIDWQRAGVTTRLTLDPADDIGPIWGPDSKHIAFTTYRKGNADIYVAENGVGEGKETPLLETGSDEVVKDWTKDGKYLVYLTGPESQRDIWALPLVDGKADSAHKPFPVVQGKFQKGEAQVSYDGKWLAYTSDRTTAGTFQVYVRSFPAGDQEIAVSTTGGGQPRWRKDGKELYYRSEDYIMSVEIKPGEKLEAGIPKQVFSAPYRGSAAMREPNRHALAASPDGQRFVLRAPPMVRATEDRRSVGEAPYLLANEVAGGRGTAGAGGSAFNGLTVIQHWLSGIGKGAK
jgi:Tol biopolymer transport system component